MLPKGLSAVDFELLYIHPGSPVCRTDATDRALEKAIIERKIRAIECKNKTTNNLKKQY